MRVWRETPGTSRALVAQLSTSHGAARAWAHAEAVVPMTDGRALVSLECRIAASGGTATLYALSCREYVLTPSDAARIP